MDRNVLKYQAFVTAVETGSFARAAELLNYSQAGISRMIRDLEKEWKLTLLERNRSGVCLTTDGRRVLPYAKGLCEEYRKLQMQVDDLHDVKSGILRIGTFSGAAAHWLPDIIGKFLKDYPGIDYELLLGDYTEIEQWIAEGRVDCGFLRLPTRTEFETVSLHKDRLMAILPENHPLAGAERVPLEYLCREPFMMLKDGAGAGVSELFESHGLKPEVKFTTWDDYAIMSMVEKGLGLSILPELILRRIPYKIAARPLDVPAYRTIGIAMRSRKNASVAVQHFMGYLDYRNSWDALPADGEIYSVI